MTDSSHQAVEILSVTASGLARLAAERTVDRIAEPGRYGPQPVDVWREHLAGRVADLALELSVERGGQFAEQVGWARVTFSSRGLPDADLRTGLECLREVLATELPEQAARPAADCLDDTLARWDALGAPEPSALHADDEAGRLAAGYVLALLEGDRQQACDLVLHAVREGRLSAREAVVGVCLPAQKELGRMWHLDEITIAEEHFVSSTTVRLLSQIMALAPRAPRVGRTLVAATVTGNEHEIGLRAVCDLFEMEGWRVVFQGGNLPIDDLVWSVEAFGADLLLLSATQFADAPAVRDTITHVRAAREAAGKPPVPILVGGAAFVGSEDLWKEVGADVFAARARDAVAAATQLLDARGAAKDA